MTTDLRDKTVEELRGVLYHTDGVVEAERFDELARRLSEAQQQIAEKDAALAACLDALHFYADPDTYFAIGIFPDRPCGEFIDDFSAPDMNDPEYVKPGKLARSVIKSLPASAKHDAKILRAAREQERLKDISVRDYLVACDNTTEAVRAKKGEKGRNAQIVNTVYRKTTGIPTIPWKGQMFIVF